MSNVKETPVNSSHLSNKELEMFKKRLLNEKEIAENKIKELKSRLNDLNSNSGDNQSSQDHHQGDLGSSENQKNAILSSIENQTEKLDQITIALDRVETGNYGVCIKSGEPIQKERLKAIPYALRSVAAKD
ncbi:TraR/DksA family transcriptional regulator [Rhodohalobacter halophilus]|uniref:TraR/DksA family transcriptional regulator n=1 Tax=Rhodohalobacter halophilus TaxID=1812810 RepID=UPI00083F83DF|nr:TraR/DksA C4-type zinc finger protein [Rhodohalobacter halophilus]